jgi:predicted HAD superfamily Cof-like phosphohydrolase
MASNFDDVGNFNEKFGLDNVTHYPIGPRDVPDEVIKYRIKFMEEELDEFVFGYDERDHAQMADALVDLAYVVFGTAHMLGYPWQELWNEVQRANMTKVRAASASMSKRNSALDVVKPPGWTPPHITEILRDHGWEVS